MNLGGISLDAYKDFAGGNYSGFGEASMDDVNALNKALSAGELRGGAVEGQINASGTPLKVESLEKTLKVLTYKANNIVFWKDMPVLPAYNTVEEYNKQISYGHDDIGAFTNEGELPEETDSTFVRESQLVKYMGTVRQVTHQMTLVNTNIGDIVNKYSEDGTLWILRQLEQHLFSGNSNLVSQQFKGFWVQQMEDFTSEIEWLDSDFVVDCRGYTLDQVYANQASATIAINFGFATDLYASPQAMADFVDTFYPKQRLGVDIGKSRVGLEVTEFVSQNGPIDLKQDVFLQPKPALTTAVAATGAKAPAAPLADGVAPIAAVGATAANTKWDAGTAGDYLYAVRACNRYGKSAITVLSASPTTIVTNGAVDLKFTAGSGAFAPTYFEILRSDEGATAGASTKYYHLFDISATQLAAGYNGGAAGVVRDLNRYLPNTTKGLMIERTLEVLSFKQLAPLMKMDLARLGPAIRFMILLYGTPILYAPRKIVTFINIGSTIKT